METFRMISVSACFLGIVITMFDSLCPSDKSEKQLKVIFSLIFLLSILTPVLNGRIELPDINETITANSDYYDSVRENADVYFIESVERNISAVLETELHKSNIFPEEIQTSVNISENSSISISEVRVTVADPGCADAVRNCIAACTEENVTVIIKVKERTDED